jgi:uncharacterized protein (TIGR03083 family)
MNRTASIDVNEVARIDHKEAMRITAVENDKFLAQLQSFEASDWTKPTDCALWDVHAVAAHLVGSAASQASPVEFVRQVRKGRPFMAELGSPYWWDGMNQLQVIERQGHSANELITEWSNVSAKALRARTKMPRAIANRRFLNLPAPVGRQPLAYLFDIGFTRDLWMHRVDLAQATGRPMDVDADHDGRIMADIVAEWAGTHGEPFTLMLGGPAGGTYCSGTNGEHVEIDAVEFGRTLAGRVHGTGVLAHPLPL